MATYTYDTTDRREAALTEEVTHDNALRASSTSALPPRTNAQYVTDTIDRLLDVKASAQDAKRETEKTTSLAENYRRASPDKRARMDAAIEAILDEKAPVVP